VPGDRPPMTDNDSETIMRLDTSMHQRMSQHQILAPRMIQSMEILQLPIMDLQARIRQELDENPALELTEATIEELQESGEVETPPEGGEEKVADPDAEMVIDDDHELDFNRLEALSQDYGEAFNEDHRPSRNGIDEESDRKHDAMSNMPSRPKSLHDYLTEQLSFVDMEPDQAEVLKFLISYLDDNGYLKAPILDLANDYPYPLKAGQLEEALKVIQTLDPLGVGARDVKECLLLQLTPETPHADVVRALIEHHLDDVAYNRLPVIQRRTGYDINLIQAAIEVLKHLNPKPGAQFSAENIPYVVPDIIVDRTEEGEYTVKLVDDWVPTVHIPRHVIELARNKEIKPADKEYIKRRIQAAQWLMESIEQRRGTLEKVTRAIIKHQRAFLDMGPEHIEPLKMQQIADQVGVHVTTVSRAVDDKWVQTPRGIFPLKRFFGGGTHTATGEEVAWETIKNKLLELIDKEDKSNPLSDEDLVAKLQESGYPVARRTVTKYRKMLNIPSSRQRKDWSLVS
jgi:RNA polymerase sigma-54 factor